MDYFKDGQKYEGDFKMIMPKEKEYIIIIMGIDMKEILKMIKKKEKEYIIIIKVNGKGIDMKEIGKMIKKKEKEYIIIKMVIERWEII